MPTERSPTPFIWARVAGCRVLAAFDNDAVIPTASTRSLGATDNANKLGLSDADRLSDAGLRLLTLSARYRGPRRGRVSS